MITIKTEKEEVKFRLGCEKCALQYKEHQVRESMYLRMNQDGLYTLKRICGGCGHSTEYRIY
jgi:heterodisulfide reductase subunit B